jgi:hypothetical protein
MPADSQSTPAGVAAGVSGAGKRTSRVWDRPHLSSGDIPHVRPARRPYRQAMLLPLMILALVNLIVPALLLHSRDSRTVA